MNRIAGVFVGLALLLAFTAVGVVLADEGESTTEETCRTLIEEADIDPSMDRNTLIPSCVDAVDNHGMDAEAVVNGFAKTDFSTTLNRWANALRGTSNTPTPTPTSTTRSPDNSEKDLGVAEGVVINGVLVDLDPQIEPPLVLNVDNVNPNYDAYEVSEYDYVLADRQWNSQSICGDLYQPQFRFENGDRLPRNYAWRCENDYWQLIWYLLPPERGTFTDDGSANNDGDIDWDPAGQCDEYMIGYGKGAYEGRWYRWLYPGYIGELACNYIAWTVNDVLVSPPAPAGYCQIEQIPDGETDAGRWTVYHYRPTITTSASGSTPGEAEIQKGMRWVTANALTYQQAWETLHPIISSGIEGETRREAAVDCSPIDAPRAAVVVQTFAVTHRVTGLTGTCSTNGISLQWAHPHPDYVTGYVVETKRSGNAYIKDPWTESAGSEGGGLVTSVEDFYGASHAIDCSVSYLIRVKAQGNTVNYTGGLSPATSYTYEPSS